MEETIHRCDMQVKRRGSSEPVSHGVVIEDYTGPFVFSVDGVDYLIDLCDEHRTEAKDSFNALVAAARVVTPAGNSVRKALRGQPADKFTTKQARDWLKEQGLDVADSGRLPNDLLERYRREAHR